MRDWLRKRSCVRLGETFRKGLSGRLCERFVDMFCKKLGEMLQIYLRRAISTIQESLILRQLPSPDKGYVR